MHENRPGSFQSEETVFATYNTAGVRVFDIRDAFVPKEIAVLLAQFAFTTYVGAGHRCQLPRNPLQASLNNVRWYNRLRELVRMTTHGDYQIFEAGDVTLQSGVVFPCDALAYKTYGTLNARKDNVIVYPTSFSAQHYDTEWLIQPGGVLDPDRYFIVIPNLFGNGLSSSPSNSGVTPFPDISYHDAVAVQRRLLVEQFGISKHRAGLWLVDGRHAGLSLGGAAIPTWWNGPRSSAAARDARPTITCSSKA